GAPSQDANSGAAPICRTPWLRNCFKQLPNVNKSSVREARRGERVQSLSANLGAAVAGQAPFQFSAGQGTTRTVAAGQCSCALQSRELKQSDRQSEDEIPQTSRLLGRNSVSVAGPTCMEQTMIRMIALVLLVAIFSFPAIAQQTK